MTTEIFLQEIKKVEDQLLRYAVKLWRDSDKAKALYTETIRVALRDLSEAPEAEFSRWMYTIMRDLFIADYREEIRRELLTEREREQIDLSILGWGGNLPTA